MKIGKLSLSVLGQRLLSEGVAFRTGCLTVRIQSPLRQIAEGIHILYADHDFQPNCEFSDCHIRVLRSTGLGQFSARPTRMIVNGKEWHRTERHLQMASLEWAINWFVFRYANHLLVIHAATLERDGVGLVMPAHSGSGKSTLAAALAHAGWRLFSDEQALIQPESGELLPHPRPISLKGDSIPVIRKFAPEARFGPVVYHRKDRRLIGHVKPPIDAVERMDQPAMPGLILFPTYKPGSQTILTPVLQADSFIRVAQTSLNYSKLHRRGFNALRNVIDRCQSYELTYSNLPEAVDLIANVAAEIAPLVPHA